MTPAVDKNALSPFRPSTLLTRDFFVSHCKKHGVIVTLKDLEELHRLGILYPAVRLQLYAVPFRKIFASFDGVKEWRFVYKDHTDRFETEAVEIQMYYSEVAFPVSSAGTTRH